MATKEEQEKQVLEAFKRIGEVWGKARKGIIVTFNGARVGTWIWNPGRMMLKSTDATFNDVVKELQRNGIPVQEPVRIAQKNEITMSLGAVPLGAADPGTLDHELKLKGYYLIDLDTVPVQ